MISGPSERKSQVPNNRDIDPATPQGQDLGAPTDAEVQQQHKDTFVHTEQTDWGGTVSVRGLDPSELRPVSEKSAKDLASLVQYRLQSPATFDPANGHDFSALKGVTVRAKGEVLVVSAPIGSDVEAVRAAMEDLIASTPLAKYAATERQYLEADRLLRVAIAELQGAFSVPSGDAQHQLMTDKAIAKVMELLPYATDGIEQARSLVAWMDVHGVPDQRIDQFIAGVSAFPELAEVMTTELERRRQQLEPNVHTPPVVEPTPTPTDFSAFLPSAPVKLSADTADQKLRGAIHDLENALSMPSSPAQHQLAVEQALPKIVAALPYVSDGGEQLRGLARWMGWNGVDPSLVAGVVGGLAASPELQSVMAEDVVASRPPTDNWDPASAIQALKPNEEWNLGWGITGGAVLVGSFNQGIRVQHLQDVAGKEQKTVEASTIGGKMVEGSNPFAETTDRYVVTVERGMGGGVMAGLGIRLGPAANLAVVGMVTGGVSNSVELTFDNPQDAARAVKLIQSLRVEDPRKSVEANAPFSAQDKQFLLDHLSALEFVPGKLDASLLAIAGIGPQGQVGGVPVGGVVGGASIGGGISGTFRIELPAKGEEGKGPKVVMKKTYQVMTDLSQFVGGNVGKASYWAGGLGNMTAHIDAVQTEVFQLPADSATGELTKQMLQGDWRPLVEQAIQGEPIEGRNKMDAILSYHVATDAPGGTEGQQMAIELEGEPADMIGALWDMAHSRVPLGASGDVKAQVFVNPTKTSGFNQPSLGVYFGALINGHLTAATTSTGNAVFGFKGKAADAVPKIWEFMTGAYTVEGTRQQLIDGTLTMDKLAERVALKLVSLADLQTLVKAKVVDPEAFGDAFRRKLITGEVDPGLASDLAQTGLLPDSATDRAKYLARPPVTDEDGQAPIQVEPPPFDQAFQDIIDSFPPVDFKTLKGEIAAGKSSLSFAYGNVLDEEPRADIEAVSPGLLESAMTGRDLRIFGSETEPGRGIVDAKTGEVLFWVKNVEEANALMATSFDALAETPSDDALWNALEPVAPILDLGAAESALTFGRLELVVPGPDGESATAEELHELKENDLRLVSGLGPDGRPLPAPVDGKPRPGNILVDLTTGAVLAVFEAGPTP